MKVCVHCKVEKPRTDFNRASTAADGLQSWCKRCKADHALATYHAGGAPAREAARAKMAARRANDPERERAYIARWRTENADRVRARDAERRRSETRRAWQAAYWREWKALHPERAREIARKGQAVRRARLADAFVEAVDPRVVFERDEGVCGICGLAVDRADYHVDHVVPIFAGGEHSYANVQISHPVCNLRKGSKTIEVVKGDDGLSRIAA